MCRCHFLQSIFLCVYDCLYFSGSPAEDVDLRVEDEIVEVNGESLSDASHKEVINYIHQVERR